MARKPKKPANETSPSDIERNIPETSVRTEPQASPIQSPEPTTENPPSLYPDATKPFEIAHHNAAGLRLFKFPRFKQMQLRFDREVPPATQEQLEQDHWRHRPEEGIYTKQYGLAGEAAAIVEARRLYGEFCTQLAPAAARGR